MTHFSWPVDGSIIGLYLLATMVAGIMVRKYVGKVEHFLVAGREMNVYLGIASLAATEFGIVTCMYTAQNGYKYGFAGATPGLLQAIAMFVIGVTGFCVKPLRDSGVMTIPELFEKRFGSFIRWLAGVVIVLGGLLNMGVFLRMGGDFLLLVTGLHGQYLLEIMMTVLLVAVAVYTILGGMLSVLVTDFLQFVVMSVGLIVVTVMILTQVGWSRLVTTVETHYGTGGFNPFANAELGFSFVVFQIFLQTAATLTWQTCIARLLSAKDTKTGRKVYTGTAFFFCCRFLIPGLWGMAALAILGWSPLNVLSPKELATIPPPIQTKIAASQAPDALKDVTAAEKKALPREVVDKLDNVSLHGMPRFLGQFLPIGLMGLLIAAMLAADMSTDSSYMLTWGSVIYNDIMAPFRKTRWSEKKGLLWNRFIVAMIGVYLLIFGLWYKLEGDLWAYLGITGTIYLASMSVLLIACCYWKRANNWGAAGAIVCGALIPVAFLVMQKLPATANLAQQIGPWYSGIAAYVIAGLAMIIGSLLKPGGADTQTVPLAARSAEAVR
jgi:SSS family solute:Na+ symporter